MHAMAIDDLRTRRAQLEDPKNFGFGSIGDEEVEQLQQVEALLHGDGNGLSAE
jgi:hypothetical protein